MSGLLWRTLGTKSGIILTTGLASSGLYIYSTRYYSVEAKDKKWLNDQVILHQFKRSRHLPNLSGYALKLETYLRMARIPYQMDGDDPFGPKGKCPWISHKGQDIGDSSFIIEYLNGDFGIDLNAKLTPQQRAHSHAYKSMAEEHLYPAIIVQRFVNEPTNNIFYQMPLPGTEINLPLVPAIATWLATKVYKRKLKKAYYYQGMGRHSSDEIYHLGKGDLKALSDLLGKQKYMFGETPTELDCVLFGVLAQMVWGSIGTKWPNMVKDEFPTLYDYVVRIKEAYYPDWEQLLWKG